MEPPFAPLVPLTHRTVDAAIQRGLNDRGFDVRTAHSAVLANIDIATGTRATVLAERATVTKQAIGEVVDDLEARGYVKRVPDPADRRAKLIKLTRKGHKAISAAFEVIGSIEEATLNAVGVKDVQTARRVLETMIELCSPPVEQRRGARPSGGT